MSEFFLSVSKSDNDLSVSRNNELRYSIKKINSESDQRSQSPLSSSKIGLSNRYRYRSSPRPISPTDIQTEKPDEIIRSKIKERLNQTASDTRTGEILSTFPPALSSSEIYKITISSKQ
jgi:hypothetical protein